MAATRLIALHINKGKTVAQCLADRTDYSENAAKTEDGKYISAYACDAKTCDEEFLLSKRQYEHITGRTQAHDVIAYQIRQSFKPGEITPEEANKVGYETAMRFTKGKHAFIVATHVDRAHIHNHIIFNSTTLDCTRKFRDFRLSGLALARLSDIVCLEHRLSVIIRKPYGERQKRTEYPEKKSQRDEICEAIDAALVRKPKDFRELIGILCNDLKNRHVTRLREGKCEFRQGFAFNDLLTNLERIAAHCSNVAVAMIETETSEFDTHEYLKSVRHMKDDAYLECFDSYARKYSIPPTKKEKKNK